MYKFINNFAILTSCHNALSLTKRLANPFKHCFKREKDLINNNLMINLKEKYKLKDIKYIYKY